MLDSMLISRSEASKIKLASQGSCNAPLGAAGLGKIKCFDGWEVVAQAVSDIGLGQRSAKKSQTISEVANSF